MEGIYIKVRHYTYLSSGSSTIVELLLEQGVFISASLALCIARTFFSILVYSPDRDHNNWWLHSQVHATIRHPPIIYYNMRAKSPAEALVLVREYELLQQVDIGHHAQAEVFRVCSARTGSFFVSLNAPFKSCCSYQQSPGASGTGCRSF